MDTKWTQVVPSRRHKKATWSIGNRLCTVVIVGHGAKFPTNYHPSPLRFGDFFWALVELLDDGT